MKKYLKLKEKQHKTNGIQTNDGLQMERKKMYQHYFQWNIVVVKFHNKLTQYQAETN